MRITNLSRFSIYRGLHNRRAATIGSVAFGILLSVIGSGTLARESHVPQSGGVKGQVVADIPEKRKPLAGVVVHLSGERLPDRKMQVVSDEEGRYNFTGLVAGDYVVSVELQGFKKYEQKTSVQIEATVELDRKSVV